ncbi:uncharacterized protein LOC126671302 [Mercurialis annua]|uniref:uncharacterized protein LOC126671302 n=1 Tax=Mercurialis annua TaxID=3986 RepID=UPI00215EF7E2|nr:uncharacterized protein LOC126671302 [Mercurialis annua]
MLDKCIWPSSSQGFSAASMVKALRRAAITVTAVNKGVQFKFCWKSEAPPRVKFFIWTALHNSISSLAFLASRGIITNGNVLCDICGEEETMNHIFIHCLFVRKIWYMVFQNLGVAWVLPYTFEEFLTQWSAIIPLGVCTKLWTTTWMIFIWEIWKCRNRRVFDNKESSVHDIVFRSFTTAVFYFKCNHPSFAYSGLDLYRNPDSILFS